MKKIKTAEQAFLAWCKRHSIKSRKKVSTFTRGDGTPGHSNWYSLPFALTIGPVTIKRVRQCQNTDWPSIHFNSDGGWSGGDPEIWSIREFPWMDDKYEKRPA